MKEPKCDHLNGQSRILFYISLSIHYKMNSPLRGLCILKPNIRGTYDCVGGSGTERS